MGDISIYCKRVKYLDTVDFNEVNLFNRTGIESYTNKTDISNDIIEISSLKYDKQSIISGDSLELVKKCGDVSIKVGTISNTYKTLFAVKSDQKKYLYIFWVRYNGLTLFSGVSTQKDITYNESSSKDSDRITIKIPSLLNHFLNYFKSKECNITDMETAFINSVFIGGEYRTGSIETFFRKLFFNNDIALFVENNTGLNWEINRQPFFYVSNTNVYSFVTNGFRKIGAPTVLGQYEYKTDFFIKSCNAMGWDFSITNDFNNESITLKIFNRSRTGVGTVIDKTLINNIDYQTEIDLSDIDYIVIKDGLIKGGTGYLTPQGIPVKIISLKEDYNNRGYFFGYAQNYGTYYVLYPNSDYYMIANVLGTNDILDFGKIRYTDLSSWGSRYTERLRIANKNILYIDTGENEQGTRVDMQSGNHQLDSNDVINQNDVVFKGNYGSMFVLRSGNNVTSYDNYSRTSQFKDNFKILLKNKDSDIITLTYNGLYTDFYVNDFNNISIYDANDSYLSDTWNIVEMELDLNKRTSKIKMKKAL